MVSVCPSLHMDAELIVIGHSSKNVECLVPVVVIHSAPIGFHPVTSFGCNEAFHRWCLTAVNASGNVSCHAAVGIIAPVEGTQRARVACATPLVLPVWVGPRWGSYCRDHRPVVDAAGCR